ncbi:XylR family transcriptional regulator [Leeuwenhoekiella sp.]|uniref:XylR family transcriptional regulator n=1 Tax=Leeuwenhoekiella sp. TaxID=1977054 RepID=UPI000C383475|nr:MULTISPECIES: XylR family transcriptional regulator [Flavobacteriaceae]MAO15761.1 XylR family transcriptional regulator [Allomuricauda sp.]MBA4745899.1 XylR family transcriptional regulator [Allomuricauda sp.]MBA82203.1 XylR family transcriptional regulator [Leeuwenhoekiella sp.]
MPKDIIRKKRYKVALLLETSNAYSRGIIKGIYSYIKEHDDWDVFLGEYGRGEPNPEWLLSWKGDGIIARIENKTTADLIQQSNLPTVDTSSANLIPNIPWVETDDEKIAQVALKHLQNCGFKHFAFLGANFNWSKWRSSHFTDLLEQNGFICHEHHISIDLKLNLVAEQKKIDSWLSSLPKPIGIFAAYDQLGRLIIDSSHRQGFMVPEDIAVIGVDNDPLICELCSPPLTSIIPDTHTTGYLAATLLEQLMKKKKIDTFSHRISPLGIKKRRSTEALAIEDPHMSRALHYIYEHATSGTFNIEDVLNLVPMTRRVFEKKFVEIVGRTPYKEMQRVRVNRLKELLTETELGLFDIAEKTGFEHISYMSYLFKRETGISPIAYREGKSIKN